MLTVFFVKKKVRYAAADDYYFLAKDRSRQRGYYQKSVAIVTPLPFIGLFQSAVRVVGPLIRDFGTSLCESVCHHIAKWSAAVSKRLFRTFLLGLRRYLGMMGSHLNYLFLGRVSHSNCHHSACFRQPWSVARLLQEQSHCQLPHPCAQISPLCPLPELFACPASSSMTAAPSPPTSVPPTQLDFHTAPPPSRHDSLQPPPSTYTAESVLRHSPSPRTSSPVGNSLLASHDGTVPGQLLTDAAAADARACAAIPTPPPPRTLSAPYSHPTGSGRSTPESLLPWGVRSPGTAHPPAPLGAGVALTPELAAAAGVPAAYSTAFLQGDAGAIDLAVLLEGPLRGGGGGETLEHLWELILTGQPLLVLAPTPVISSSAVVALVALVDPVRVGMSF